MQTFLKTLVFNFFIRFPHLCILMKKLKGLRSNCLIDASI